MTSDCPATGENIKGTVKINQPFGNGTCRGTLEVPITKVTLGLKGGTLSYESVGKVVGATFQSKWHITKGTGEFKGASGSGNATGTLDGRATLIGTVRF